MLRRMIRTRLTAVTLLAVGVAIWGACAAKQQNGQECLKNADCESDRCVQYICIDPNASRPGITTGGDTGTPVVDTGAEAAPTDTGPADAGADTMMAAETAADTSGD
jgi:hypothetical protein